MIIDFHDRPYALIEAYENHKKMQRQHNDYYKALNSTSKHFLIEHETLKSFISEVNNRKRTYKKDWIEGKLKYLEDRAIEKEFDEMFGHDNVELEDAKIIDFKDLRL